MDKASEQAASFILKHIQTKPKIGVVLGSGLGAFAHELTNEVTISYESIPFFPKSTVKGHAGQLVIGKLGEKIVVAMQGRFHFYEGYTMKEVTFPIRVMKRLGISTLVVTNAAGGINTSFRAGNLMLITDHINNISSHPLVGPNDESFGVRFPDMSNAYSKRLRTLVKEEAARLQIDIQEGVYVGNSGPSYETPAEIRMLRKMGGDAVGMSTVPEVIVARHCGMEVVGISCISNMAAGIEEQPLSHDDVILTTKQAERDFLLLIKEAIMKM